MTVRLVYRLRGGENLKRRQCHNSPMLMLISSIPAAEQLRNAHPVFVNDGPSPAENHAINQRNGRTVNWAIGHGARLAAARLRKGSASGRRSRMDASSRAISERLSGIV